MEICGEEETSVGNDLSIGEEVSGRFVVEMMAMGVSRSGKSSGGCFSIGGGIGGLLPGLKDGWGSEPIV